MGHEVSICNMLKNNVTHFVQTTRRQTPNEKRSHLLAKWQLLNNQPVAGE